jgi:hypothetical protein
MRECREPTIGVLLLLKSTIADAGRERFRKACRWRRLGGANSTAATPRLQLRSRREILSAPKRL